MRSSSMDSGIVNSKFLLHILDNSVLQAPLYNTQRPEAEAGTEISFAQRTEEEETEYSDMHMDI